MTSNFLTAGRPSRGEVKWVVALILGLASSLAAEDNPLKGATRRLVKITSSEDGTAQPCYVIEPKQLHKNAKGETPLLVSLHSWSGNYTQRNSAFEKACVEEGWIYVFPDFRGANKTPQACGSELAQQDILDAVAWAKSKYSIDPGRVYLAGVSGGGHMTMLMAARHPQQWTACSAWVGISDLAAWHAKHKDGGYGQMMRACCEGAPGDSAAVDRQYRQRSPLTFLAQAKDVPLDIAAGILDGHTGSVPIRHSLDAFNVIALANDAKVISEDEIQQLSERDGRLKNPQPSDQVSDASFGRAIYLRRHAGESRVTIFEGGHEGIAKAAFAWLKAHK